MEFSNPRTEALVSHQVEPRELPPSASEEPGINPVLAPLRGAAGRPPSSGESAASLWGSEKKDLGSTGLRDP